MKLHGEKTYWGNPFYDDILLFLQDMPSSQEKFKPIDIDNKIFQLIEKNNVNAFRSQIKSKLLNKSKPTWPYSCNLFVSFHITGFKKDLVNKDLDNMLKTMFDTLKGIVFLDDCQVIKLSAEKIISSQIQGITVGIKRLDGTEDIQIAPYMWSTEDNWLKERSEKMSAGKHTYFDHY